VLIAVLVYSILTEIAHIDQQDRSRQRKGANAIAKGETPWAWSLMLEKNGVVVPVAETG